MPTLALAPEIVQPAPLWAGLANPPVLFFFLGAIAALVRSNLRVPSAITKLLSLYLLWSIGFQGGVKLAHGGIGQQGMLALVAGIVLACLVPISSFAILRRMLKREDAAAIAAAYGSISAVTFMTASTVLEAKHIPYGGHMVAAMALMESPAIIVGVLLLRLSQRNEPDVVPITSHIPAKQHARKHGWATLLHEAFLNGPVLLLLGSMLIGIFTSERGYAMFKPLCTDLFSGVLVFFLLDLGILAARRLKDLRKAGWKLIVFGLATPPMHAAVALACAWAIGLGVGDTVLLMVLAGSASYIAVPAAMRLVIPKANPGLYIPLPLAVTFPFNVAIGIPLYIWLAERVVG